MYYNNKRKLKSFYSTLVCLILGIIVMVACDSNELEVQPEIIPPQYAIGDQVSISNSGFESDFSGWNDTDPSSISSSDANSGSKSAKITGSGGKIERTVSLNPNTDYTLTVYVLGSWRIGATANGVRKTRSGSTSSWKAESVTFNTGSASSASIYAEYNAGEGRFDDFSLTEGSSTGSGGGSSAPIGKTIWLKASNNKYVCAEKNVANNPVEADRSALGAWEKFQVVDAGNGMIALVANANGKYVVAEKNTANNPVRANRTAIGAWEKFTWESQGSNSVALLANANGKYVSSRQDETDAPLRAISSSVSTWETFTWGEDGDSGNPGEPTDPNPGNAQIPSDLMDNCNQWKITYPDGVEDKTLCGEANNEYWYVNDDKNAMVFRVPIRSNNGSTPNSSYIRSELRERTANGSSDIYWTTSGTHVVYVKQAITHLPIVKDHLVATQIHGDKSAGIDDAMVLRLEGDHLFLSFNGGVLRSDLTIKRGYTLGTIHEVIFEVINGKHYCYYSEDGNLESAYASGNASSYLVKDGSSTVLMDRNYDQSYFKIGNYTQSNAEKEGSYTGDPNNYGEVLVYDFFVNHQ